MRRVAFLTLSNPAGFVIDDHLAILPLARRGWQVEMLPWNRPGVDWKLSLATPVIVKYRDSRTDTRTELERWIR